MPRKSENFAWTFLHTLNTHKFQSITSLTLTPKFQENKNNKFIMFSHAHIFPLKIKFTGNYSIARLLEKWHLW